MLFGLARLAGLRTPSETHRLTWDDVDWDRRRLNVFAPKTSRQRIHRGLEAIVKQAGLVPWDDLWQTLRRSCETQWALEFPQHVVSQWIGHSVAVSLRHYVQTPDYLFDMAAAGKPLRAAKSAAVNPGTVGNGEESEPAGDVNDASATDEKNRRKCRGKRGL